MRLIDADAIMEALNIFNGGSPHFLNGIKTAKEIITAAPTIEAEPVRRGRWRTEWLHHKERVVCSECRCFADEMTDYCPNCGALNYDREQYENDYDDQVY